MRLDLTLTDTLTKVGPYYHSKPETEEYERAKLDGTGNAEFIAKVLRGLADEIDPPRSSVPLFNEGVTP